MVTQYPHTIKFPQPQGETYRENGEWQTGDTQPQTLTSKCRFEPENTRQSKEVTDGVLIEYKGIIYLPLTTLDIENGATVEIDGVLAPTQAVLFYRGQLNCRLYV